MDAAPCCSTSTTSPATTAPSPTSSPTTWLTAGTSGGRGSSHGRWQTLDDEGKGGDARTYHRREVHYAGRGTPASRRRAAASWGGAGRRSLGEESGGGVFTSRAAESPNPRAPPLEPSEPPRGNKWIEGESRVLGCRNPVYQMGQRRFRGFWASRG